MSADCLFVLKSVHDPDQIKNTLLETIQSVGGGICFSPQDALLLFNDFDLQEDDMVFQPTDSPDTTDAGLLLSPENYYINGKQSQYPLYTRLEVIQRLASISLKHSRYLEIYISEDNPYLPDYEEFNIACDKIAITLYDAYQRSYYLVPVLPCIMLRVRLLT